MNEEAAWVIAPDAHEAIIDKRTWHKAQAAMKRRREGRPAGSSPQGSLHMLTGIVVCAKCGGTWKGQTARRRLKDGSVKTYRYYRCRVRHVSGKAACPSCAVEAEALEAGVVAGVREFAGLDSDRETWEEMLKAQFAARVPDTTPDVAPLAAELAEIEARITAVMESLDTENLRLVNRKLTEWRQEAEALRSEIAAIEAQTAQEHAPDDMVAEALAYLQRLSEALTSASVADRRVVLATALARVEIDSDRGVAEVFVNRESATVGPNVPDTPRHCG